MTVTGNSNFEPDDSAVTIVRISVDCDVFCKEAGQLTSPDTLQLTPVWVKVTDVVMVTRSCRLRSSGAVVIFAASAVVSVFDSAQILAITVLQIGTEVSGIGPQKSVPMATVAPALAPSAS